MAASPQDMRQRFRERWTELPAGLRRWMAVSAAVSLIAAGAILYWASRPRYGVLFSHLAPEDAGAVIEKLKTGKVAYRLAENGTSIEVPQGQLYEVKMQMATEGIPESSGPGWELFDRSAFGMTEFTQKLNYQRALQGELARTIMQLSQVQSARVHISIPEASLFEEEHKEPTASVVLMLRGGRPLHQREIQGVVNLVSRAIPAMKPENVSIIDSRGNMLSTDQTTGFSPEQSEAHLELQTRIERGAQRDIQTMLDKVLGPDKALVRVNAKVDFSRKETNSETFTPGGPKTGILQEQHSVEEQYSGRGDTAAGQAPGMIANVAGAAAGLGAYRTPGSSPGNYSRKEATTRFQISKKVEHLVQAPGDIQRMSVAIMVNGDLDDAKKQSLISVATAAAGLDTARAEQISVVALPFDTSAATEEKKQLAEAARQEMVARGMRYGVAVLMMLFLFLIVRQALRRGVPVSTVPMLARGHVPGQPRIPGEPGQVVEGRDPLTTVGQLLDEMDHTQATPLGDAQAQAAPVTSAFEARLRWRASEEPELVARILRNWLGEHGPR